MYKDILEKYKSVFKLAWKTRNDHKSSDREPHEIDFLPSALVLQEKPIHPAPRIFCYLIVIFFASFILWLFFGKLDVVVTASGQVIPTLGSKVIKSLDGGLVETIDVTDGQYVYAGTKLIQLDTSIVTSNITRFQIELDGYKRDIKRYQYLLSNYNIDQLRFGKADQAVESSLGELEKQDKALALAIKSETDNHNVIFQGYKNAIKRKETEREMVLLAIKKYREIIPITRQRETDYESLLEKKYVSKHQYLELKSQLVESERDLYISLEKLSEIDSLIDSKESEYNQYSSAIKYDWSEQLRKAKLAEELLSEDLKKSFQQKKHMTIIAPVDGVVQQLSVNTVGGVVTAAEPLMVIVPEKNSLEVEAILLNKDRGFVMKDQDVQIKVDAFPFTKYGTIGGSVLSVSSDSVENESLGPVFDLRVALKDNAIAFDNGETIDYLKIKPGMAVTVEIKITKRRVIEYFLGPFIAYTHDSLREI